MAILVTGGTGKTGKRLARLLHEAGYTVYVTSRSADKVPAPYKGVPFDWADEGTMEHPFKMAAFANQQIEGVYLVGPPMQDMATVMNPFIDLAIKHGVKRFVQLSASPIKKGSPPTGVVQVHLEEIGADYCTLRPTYFQENFLQPQFLQSILKEDTIFSAAGDGRIPVVSVDDIADAAFKALTDEVVKEREMLVLGPELLSYDDAAALFTEVLGRPISHTRIPEQEMEDYLLRLKFPAAMSRMLAQMDTAVAGGAEEACYKGPDARYNGRRKLKDFIVANKAAWVE